MNYRFPDISDELIAAVREEMSRIFADGTFKSPARRKKLLRYIVEETLAGRGDNLMGAPIAQTVFGRDENFNHQSDPVVRIEARRLRNDLVTYYALSGQSNPVRISIPKGRYVAHFDWAENPFCRAPEAAPNKETIGSRTPERWKLRAAVALAVLLFVSATVLVFWPHLKQNVSDARSGPSVLVTSFDATPDDADIAVGLSYEIVTELMQFPGIRAVTQDRSPKIQVDSSGQSSQEVSHVLRGILHAAQSELTVNVRLSRATDDTVVWSEKFSGDMTAGTLRTIERNIASNIASQLGQTYGVINQDLGKNVDRNEPGLSSYRCILKVYRYRGNPPGEASYAPIKTCLEQTVIEEPDYAEAWALLALHYNDAIRFNRVAPHEVESTRANAFEAASRAMALDPDNARAALALSAIYFYQKNFKLGEKYGRLAVKNAPNNPEMLALLGYRLIMRGNFEEGTPLLERAVAKSVFPPGYNFQLIAFDRLVRGDGEGMLEMAQRGIVDGSALSYSIVAMAYGLLGNQDGAKEALRRMNEISPGFDPIARMKAHQASHEIIEAMNQTLNQAGWRRTNLAGMK